MSVMDTIRLALGNLSQAKLRTALTILGVSIGIASLSGMVSLGVGLEDQFVDRFTQSGMFDSITVMSADVGRLGAPGGRGRRGGGRGRAGAAMDQSATDERRLDDQAIARIGELANVKSVYPTVRVPVQVTYKDSSELAAATGVPMSSAGEGAFQSLSHGAFFANDEDDACMLSLEMARRLTGADPGDLIGQTVTLTYATSATNGAAPAAAQPLPLPGFPSGAPMQIQRVDVPCPIVGIVERESAPLLGGGLVSGVMIPLAKARAIDAVQVTSTQSLLRRSDEPRGYPSLTVRVTAAQHTQDVQGQIKALGYSAFSLNDLLQGAKRAFLIIDILLSLIGSIALAVSSLGIVNTMVMSILERTREIGIMKAIGGSDRDIRKIFLIEATAIGLIGGAGGVALGWVIGRLINFGTNIYIESQGGTAGDLFSMPPWLVGGAIAFSVLVSLAAGSYPARRAARLDPIQALRHD